MLSSSSSSKRLFADETTLVVCDKDEAPLNVMLLAVSMAELTDIFVAALDDCSQNFLFD